MIIDPVIYAITNIVNDKQYVGQAINKKKRWYDHRIMLKVGRHSNKHLQASYNKYGAENFIYTVVERINAIANIVEILVEREQYWMNKLNTITPNGYNLNPTAATAIGFKHSEETKLRWSEQRTGKKRSAEFALSVSIRMTGKIITEETRQKLVDSHKGNKHTEETKALMSNQRKGNKFAAGVKQTKEHIEARTKHIRKPLSLAARNRRKRRLAALDKD